MGSPTCRLCRQCSQRKMHQIQRPPAPAEVEGKAIQPQPVRHRPSRQTFDPDPNRWRSHAALAVTQFAEATHPAAVLLRTDYRSTHGVRSASWPSCGASPPALGGWVCRGRDPRRRRRRPSCARTGMNGLSSSWVRDWSQWQPPQQQHQHRREKRHGARSSSSSRRSSSSTPPLPLAMKRSHGVMATAQLPRAKAAAVPAAPWLPPARAAALPLAPGTAAAAAAMKAAAPASLLATLVAATAHQTRQLSKQAARRFGAAATPLKTRQPKKRRRC